MNYILPLMFFSLSLAAMHQSDKERTKQLTTPLLAKDSSDFNDAPNKSPQGDPALEKLVDELVELHLAGELSKQKEDVYIKKFQQKHQLPMNDISTLLRAIRTGEFNIFSPRSSENWSS